MMWTLYCFLFKFFYFSTLLLIIAKRGWGWIPMYIMKMFETFLDLLDDNINKYENNDEIMHKSYLTVNYVKERDYNHPFEVSSDFLSHGIQSILRDDLKRPFLIEFSESSLLRFTKNYRLMPFFVFGFLVRWFFIFPLRLCFLLTSAVFMLVAATICYVLKADQEFSMYCGIVFARIYNCSTGVIVQTHENLNRPKMPGLAVANHLSANDVMTIYSDCDFSGKGYSVTAQSHGGIVNYLTKFGSYLTRIVLVNRYCDNNRNGLLQTIIRHSKEATKGTYPILLFPEGYCTNNKSVLQFRKAVFDGHAPIYAIALSQETRLGNAFWAENTFLPYLIRLMTSWGSIIHVHYLPPMSKDDKENDEDFAKRVQFAIASKLSVNALPFDGKLKHEKERIKYREKIQQCVAEKFVNL